MCIIRGKQQIRKKVYNCLYFNEFEPQAKEIKLKMLFHTMKEGKIKPNRMGTTSMQSKCNYVKRKIVKTIVLGETIRRNAKINRSDI